MIEELVGALTATCLVPVVLIQRWTGEPLADVIRSTHTPGGYSPAIILAICRIYGMKVSRLKRNPGPSPT